MRGRGEDKGRGGEREIMTMRERQVEENKAESEGR